MCKEYNYLNMTCIIVINLLATYMVRSWTFITAHNFSAFGTRITIVMVLYFTRMSEVRHIMFFFAANRIWFSNQSQYFLKTINNIK